MTSGYPGKPFLSKIGTEIFHQWLFRNKAPTCLESTGSSIFIKASVIHSKRTIPADALLDIDMEGVTLSFDTSSYPDVAINDRVQLKFILPHSQGFFVADAVIKSCIPHEGKKRCRFNFMDQSRLHDLKGFIRRQIPSSLSSRVKPCHPKPIPADLEWNGGFGHGVITAISSTRIRIEADPEIVNTISYLDRLSLTFKLPDCSTSLKIVGRIAHCWPWSRKSPNTIIFEWDWGQTKDFERQEALIAVYLIRQRKNPYAG